MLNKLVRGLHHVTALADDAGKNVDFYTGLLGLRLVKKTINFDDPGVYHLYYGNETGRPGTIMTFFPYSGMIRGRHGNGQMTVTSFSVAENSLNFWIKRLENAGIPFTKPRERFNEMYISFSDAHGLGLELVFNRTDQRPGFTYGHIPIEFSIKGVYGVTLSEDRHERTASILTEGLDHVLVAEMNNRLRYAIPGNHCEFVDIVYNPGAVKGLSGSGTIHHLAFATKDSHSQLQSRERLLQLGRDVTPVIDRQYFKSIYFREPGGILFEIATNPPGFLIDEEKAHLGEELKLPAWMETERNIIENNLPPLKLPIDSYIDK